MPRGPKRTVEEQRSWLAAYEAGSPLQKIASDSKRALSTVWTGIQAARVEQNDTEVRRNLLSDAYKQHQLDLMDAMVNLSSDPPGQDIDAVQQRLLVDALHSHLPDAFLWGSLKDRDASKQTIQKTISSLVALFESMVELAPSSVRSELNREGVLKSLQLFAEYAAAGASGGIEYSSDSGALSWGAFTLSSTLTTDGVLGEIRKLHGDWQIQIADHELVAELKVATTALDQIQKELTLEAARMKLRRLIPGTCELCPGYRHVSSPRKRRRRSRGGP